MKCFFSFTSFAYHKYDFIRNIILVFIFILEWPEKRHLSVFYQCFFFSVKDFNDDLSFLTGFRTFMSRKKTRSVKSSPLPKTVIIIVVNNFLRQRKNCNKIQPIFFKIIIPWCFSTKSALFLLKFFHWKCLCILKETYGKTYLLVAFPFLGTFLDDSIDIDFYDVDQSGSCDSLGMCMWDFFVLIA